MQAMLGERLGHGQEDQSSTKAPKSSALFLFPSGMSLTEDSQVSERVGAGGPAVTFAEEDEAASTA